MMGQQQQQQTTNLVASSALRRMISLLAVAAVMAAMVALTVAPVFASAPSYRCVVETPSGSSTYFVKKGEAKKLEAKGATCNLV
jgi:flagellar biosynthesis/type III secretory pathway M-ring protein FliF/YscJ